MKENKKRDLSADSRVQNSPDDFDREFSARYQSEVNKVSLSTEQERRLSVKLHQAREASGHTTDVPQPQFRGRRKTGRIWVATAAAGALLLGAFYMAGGSPDLFNRETTLDNGGKALSEEDMGNGFGDGVEIAGNGNGTDTAVDSGGGIIDNGNSGSPRPSVVEGGEVPTPSRETWDGYFHYRSIGGSNEPHDFYYIVKADDRFTRIQVHMGRPDGTIGSGGTIIGSIAPDVIPPALPEPNAPDAGFDDGDVVDGDLPVSNGDVVDGGRPVSNGDIVDPAAGSGGGMDGSGGNASDLPLDLPGFIDERDTLATGQFVPSYIQFLDRVVVEVRNNDSWTPLSDASGQSEFKLSAQLDARAADLYKSVENGYIIVPTPGEIFLDFNFGLARGQEYRVVLETNDETILLPFVFN